MQEKNKLTQLRKLIQSAIEACGGRPSDGGIALMAAELQQYELGDVSTALSKCMRECSGNIGLKHILDRLPVDYKGHLSADEAWAICSVAFSEYASVVWTEQMAEAFGEVRHMGDTTSARMAFRKAYEGLVRRAGDKKPYWSPSFGVDPEGRARALEDAEVKGRIPRGEAMRLVPDHATPILPSDGRGILT